MQHNLQEQQIWGQNLNIQHLPENLGSRACIVAQLAFDESAGLPLHNPARQKVRQSRAAIWFRSLRSNQTEKRRLETLRRLIEPKEASAIPLVMENGLPRVAARAKMIDGVLKLHPLRPRHSSRVAGPISNVRCYI
jgi:hypothetical protein